MSSQYVQYIRGALLFLVVVLFVMLFLQYDYLRARLDALGKYAPNRSVPKSTLAASDAAGHNIVRVYPLHIVRVVRNDASVPETGIYSQCAGQAPDKSSSTGAYKVSYVVECRPLLGATRLRRDVESGVARYVMYKGTVFRASMDARVRTENVAFVMADVASLTLDSPSGSTKCTHFSGNAQAWPSCTQTFDPSTSGEMAHVFGYSTSY